MFKTCLPGTLFFFLCHRHGTEMWSSFSSGHCKKFIKASWRQCSHSILCAATQYKFRGSKRQRIYSTLWEPGLWPQLGLWSGLWPQFGHWPGLWLQRARWAHHGLWPQRACQAHWPCRPNHQLQNLNSVDCWLLNCACIYLQGLPVGCQVNFKGSTICSLPTGIWPLAQPLATTCSPSRTSVITSP